MCYWPSGPHSLWKGQDYSSRDPLTYSPSFCGGSSQKLLLWQLTALSSFSLLLASRKPSRTLFSSAGIPGKKRKKIHFLFPLSSNLLPSSKSEKPQTCCIYLFSTQKKLENVTRGLFTLLIKINSVNRRESPWISRECLAVLLREQTNQSRPRNGPPELLLTHGIWQVPWGSYLHTNPSISFLCKHVLCDLSKKFWAFSVFPTKPMLTCNIYTLFCLVVLNATQTTNIHQWHNWHLWLVLW